jgi:hypothetical protein
VRGHVVLVDQGLSNVRSIGVLSILPTLLAGEQLGLAVIAYTFCQMFAQVVFSLLAEPVLLSPPQWVESGGARWTRRRAWVLGASSAALTLAVSLLFQLGATTSAFLFAVCLISSVSDVFRCLSIRAGRPLSALARNSVLTLTVWAASIATHVLAHAHWWMIAFWALTLFWHTKATDTEGDPSSTRAFPGYRGAAVSGVIETFVSFGSTQATLSLVGALRLAQSALGPSQMLASASRIALTAHWSRTGGTGRRAMLKVVGAIGGASAIYIIVLLCLPARPLTALLHSDWVDVRPLVVPLGMQVLLLSASAPAVAHLRVRGQFRRMISIRVIAVLISFLALGIAIWLGYGIAGSLWALSVGPAITLPLWLSRGRVVSGADPGPPGSTHRLQ